MSIALDVLDSAIGRIEIRSEWGPNIDFDRPFQPSVSQTPAVTQQVLKPTIRFYDRGGDLLYTSAPYGEAGDTKWPFLAAGAGLALGMLVFAIVRP